MMGYGKRLSGCYYERRAERFLRSKGLTLLRRNYHCRFGEIDLIMRDGEVIVFVEVRRRQSESFGKAVATIARPKQLRLMRTARHYLLCTGLNDSTPCRFDAVGISGPGRHLHFDWIPNAFQ